MAISLVGTLPVSGLNLGLVASIGGLTAETAQLSARIADLTAGLAAQIQVALGFPPNPVTTAAAITAALNPTAKALEFASITANGALIGAEFGVKLAALAPRIATVSALTASVSAGVSGPKIAGWCYSGGARGFGQKLELATRDGYGTTAPTALIQALVIGTENFGSWGAFSEGFKTGGTAQSPADGQAANLTFQGELGGGDWNTGTASLLARFRLLESELNGNQSALEASLDIIAGIGLPNPVDLTDVGLDIVADIGVTGMLDNLVNAQVDLVGSIADLNAQIAAITALSGSISSQLSASGLSFWLYDGPASEFGAAFHGEVETGLPGGSGPFAPAYGVALAGSPAAMAAFGSIFTTS